jgi:hypothetical protein
MKNMFLLAAVSVVILAGCNTYSYPITMYENELPESECAIIQFKSYNGRFVPKAYNGIKLEESDINFLKIPAGKITFFGDASRTEGSLALRAKNFEFTYYFEAGKQYFVNMIVDGDLRVSSKLLTTKVLGTSKAYIEIYEVEFNRKKYHPTNYLIPFKYKIPLKDLKPIATVETDVVFGYEWAE